MNREIDRPTDEPIVDLPTGLPPDGVEQVDWKRLGGTPIWMPRGADLSQVPDELREAAMRIIKPMYEESVLWSDDPLEKSLGVTVTHLLWLELIQQYDIRREYTTVNATLGIPYPVHGAIEQLLRTIGSKVRVGHLMLQIRKLREHGEAAQGEQDAESRKTLEEESERK